MSHHISDITVSNYRSIKELSAQLSQLSPLVGQNNSGKSNLLNAIQWLISPAALDPSSFFDKNRDISIEAMIDGITSELLNDSLYTRHADRIRPRLVGQALRIRRRIPSGQFRAKDAVLEVFDPNTGMWDNPAGIDAAIKNLFPEPVRIDAMVDAPEDAAKNKATTTLGKLIAQLTRSIAEQHSARIETALQQLDALLSATGTSRPQELRTFDNEATEMLQAFFPELSLVIDFPSPQLPDLLKSGTVKVREGTCDLARDFADLGHGAQRSIQMAMVQLLAKRSRDNEASPRCTLLLIDEPELFLHPQAVEQIRLSLQKLSRNGYQVIYSTHSHLMIGRDELKTANIVRKTSNDIGTIVNRRALEAVQTAFAGDQVKQAKVLFDISNSKEVLFAKRILLVEGHSEREIVPALFEAVIGSPMSAKKVGLVKMNSCGDIRKALEILAAMGIEARALADLDFAFIEAVKAGMVQENDPWRSHVKQWFSTNQSNAIKLNGDGWPTKESEGRAEGAFRKMAADGGNSEAIRSLHEELKTKGIWVWKSGSFEQVVGLETKNDDHQMEELRQGLNERGVAAIACAEECEAFCRWLVSSG